jgi:hypothetical protein
MRPTPKAQEQPSMNTPLPKGAPETVPFAPKPIGIILLQQPEFDQTIRTLNWRKGDAQRCKLCPVCGVNPCDTCTVVIPGVIDDALSALSYRFTGGS